MSDSGWQIIRNNPSWSHWTFTGKRL